MPSSVPVPITHASLTSASSTATATVTATVIDHAMITAPPSSSSSTSTSTTIIYSNSSSFTTSTPTTNIVLASLCPNESITTTSPPVSPSGKITTIISPSVLATSSDNSNNNTLTPTQSCYPCRRPHGRERQPPNRVLYPRTKWTRDPPLNPADIYNKYGTVDPAYLYPENGTLCWDKLKLMGNGPLGSYSDGHAQGMRDGIRYGTVDGHRFIRFWSWLHSYFEHFELSEKDVPWSFNDDYWGWFKPTMGTNCSYESANAWFNNGSNHYVDPMVNVVYRCRAMDQYAMEMLFAAAHYPIQGYRLGYQVGWYLGWQKGHNEAKESMLGKEEQLDFGEKGRNRAHDDGISRPTEWRIGTMVMIGLEDEGIFEKSGLTLEASSLAVGLGGGERGSWKTVVLMVVVGWVSYVGV